MRWRSDTQSSLGARLRTLGVLCVTAAVVVALAAGTLLQSSGVAPSWLHLGGQSPTSGSVPLSLGDPAEPGFVAAKPHKKHKPHKDKAKRDGKAKGDKHRGHKHRADKGGKHSGDGKGHHQGGKDKQGGKGKHKQGAHKDNKRKPQKRKHALRAAGDVTTAGSLTLAPIDDAMVLEAEPTANYGDTSQLLVDGGAEPDVESYLLFAGVDAPVQQATLRLWVQPDGGSVDGPEISATGLDWRERDLTWETRPRPTGGVLDDVGPLTGGTWVTYDVTAAMNGNGAIAFVLLPQSDDGSVFDSRQGGNPPQLVITLMDESPTPEPEPTPEPTSTPDPGETPRLKLDAVADARVSEARPTNNYGSASRLLVDGGGSDPDVASYLRFDVAGVSGPVAQATLRLWVQPDGGSADGPEIYATGIDWRESSLTWDTRLAPTGDALDDKEKLRDGDWVAYDVTAAVSGNGPVAFVLLAESNDGTFFDAREAGNPPHLVITLGEALPTPTPIPDETPIPDPTATPTPDPLPTPSPTPSPDPAPGATLLAAGDIASCSSSGDEATAALLDGLAGTVITLGDNVYSSGTPQEFAECYEPSWGQHKSRTRPAAGNHDYQTSGAAGYFGYFDAAAGIAQQGYYSYEVGGWHIVALNSNCSRVGGCEAGSPQEQWLRQDLAAHPTACTLAYWHHPRFSFGNYGNDTRTQALWKALDEHGAEIVLTGHDHNYQRWAPRDANGAADPQGIRQFVVGTGGRSHYALGSPPPNVEAFNSDTFGILQLTLHPTGYDWTFIPVAGKSFTDTGSDACH
jgi:hypothetical protein